MHETCELLLPCSASVYALFGLDHVLQHFIIANNAILIRSTGVSVVKMAGCHLSSSRHLHYMSQHTGKLLRCNHQRSVTYFPRDIICAPRLNYWAVQATTVLDHLLITIDGFNATKAAEAYPKLSQIELEPFAQNNLDIIQSLIPARIQGQLFTNHPQLLEADMQAWLDFLQSFGFTNTQIADVLRSSPEVFYLSNVFQAGQLLLFLRQNLNLSDQVVQRCFKWAAVLSPSSTQASMAAVAQALQQHLGFTEEQLGTALQTFPDVLGWDVDHDLLPKLHFFESLGPAGKRLLDTMYDQETGLLQGLRSWAYAVAPKVALLQDVCGSEQQAISLLTSCPSVLKLPVETKLQPVLRCLATAGLNGEQVAQLLKACPKLLAEPKDAIVARINFLVDVIGSNVEDVLSYPQYCLLSLADTIGPRYYYLARQGWVDEFSDASTGTLQLQRVMQPHLKDFLADVVAATGEDVGAVAMEYNELRAEWDTLLGWCCDKAFSNLQGDQGGSLYQEQLSLFYVLVQ